MTWSATVYGNTAISNAEVAGKTEQKKGGHSLIFVKPKIPQLETGPTIKVCIYTVRTCIVTVLFAAALRVCIINAQVIFFSSLRENLQHEESCECCRLGMMLLNLLSVRSARLVSLTWTVCLQSSPVRKMTGDFEVTCLLSTCTCIPYSW